VDLHSSLAPIGRVHPLKTDQIWDELQTATLAGQTIETFSWPHTALHMVYHGDKERWHFLKWVCDFTRIMQRQDVDWAKVTALARRGRISNHLVFAVWLSGELLGASPKPGLPIPGADPAFVRAGEQVRRSMMQMRLPPDWDVFAYSFRSMESRRDKARLIASLATTLTPADYAFIRFPRRLRWLYYVVRPFRLMAKTTQFIWRRVRAT
jgi:hypothetical protein